jgi:GntR family transcriptional repressor for pyruvate dehydrogenase complex
VSAIAGGELAGRVAAYALEHGLRPGDRLPAERRFAELLGVSRPALREATRRLIDLGVVKPRLGAGTYLAEVDLSELTEVRLQLEPLAASLAAGRSSDEDLRALSDLLDALRARVGDAARFADLDLDLHRHLATASRNRVLIGCLRDLDQMLRLSRLRTAADPATRQATLGELEALVDRVIRRDPPGAAAAMRSHLESIAAAVAAAGA